MVGLIDDVLTIFNVGVGGELYAAIFICILLFFLVVRFAGMQFGFMILGFMLMVLGRAYSIDVIVFVGVFMVALIILNFIVSLIIR